MSVKITHLPAAIIDQIQSHGLSDGRCDAVLVHARIGETLTKTFLTQARLGQNTGIGDFERTEIGSLRGPKACSMPSLSPATQGTSAVAYAFYTAMAELHEMLPQELTSDRSFWNGEANAIGWVRVEGIAKHSHYLAAQERLRSPAALLEGQFLCVTRSSSSPRGEAIDVITADGVAHASAATLQPTSLTWRVRGAADVPILSFAMLEASPLDLLRQETHVVPIAVKLKLRDVRGGYRRYAFVPDLRSRFKLKLSRASKEAALAAHVLRQAEKATAQLQLTSKATIKQQAARQGAVSGNLVAASRRFVPEARTR